MKTIVVLGMHRSGTSIIAKILHFAGVSMGNEMLGTDYSNPTGHYEDIDFYELNEEILHFLGGSWLFPPQKKTKNIDQTIVFKDKIISLIKKKSKNQFWGWKDPRSCLTIDLYAPHVDNPYFIVCYREPNEIAASLKKRQDICLKHGKELTRIYNDSIQNFFENNSSFPILNIDHNYLVNNPEDSIREILAFIGLKIKESEFKNLIHLIQPKERMRELMDIARSSMKEKKIKKRFTPLYRWVKFYWWKIIR